MQERYEAADIHGVNLPAFVPGLPVESRVPARHAISDRINANLDAHYEASTRNYDPGFGGDPHVLSQHLISGMREFCEIGLDEEAVEVLDVGLRWPRSQVNGACYEYVAKAAAVHGYVDGRAKTDLAYFLTLDERRLTSGAGRPRTLEEMLDAGRSPAKTVDYALAWLTRSSTVHALVKQVGGVSALESEYQKKTERYLGVLAEQVTGGKLPVKPININGFMVEYPYTDELRICYENFQKVNAPAWAVRINNLTQPLVARNDTLEPMFKPEVLRQMLGKMSTRRGLRGNMSASSSNGSSGTAPHK